MGLFGYQFVTLTKDEVAARRLSLDQHMYGAQISQIVVILILFIARLAAPVVQRWAAGDMESRPSSPQRKYLAEHPASGFVAKFVKRARAWKWKLGNQVVSGFGTWGEWIGGGVWAVWLAFLCTQGTVPDYMHLTKRFGGIAAAHLPLHFLLAMKSPYSPLQKMLQASHETLNSLHRVLGRLITTLMVLHAAFYINFFSSLGVIQKRINDRDVAIGITCVTLVAIISSTSLIRGWSYRLFYAIHVIGPIMLLPLLYFHVDHVRPFVVESAIFLVANLILRYRSSRKITAHFSPIPGTTLTHISASSGSLHEPAQHMYIRRPGLAGYLRSNPFTIASSSPSSTVNLVARTRQGNTKTFSKLPGSHTVVLEGPYGESANLPDLSRFDHVLFVAGGVGATFIMPLWRDVMRNRKEKSLNYQDVTLVVTVRTLADMSWALDDIPASSGDERFLFVTGVKHEGPEGIEMGDSETTLDKKVERAGFSLRRSRPDFQTTVDGILSGNIGSTAVFVCGPAAMTRSMRRYVGSWVLKGKEVFWHAEEFGL